MQLLINETTYLKIEQIKALLDEIKISVYSSIFTNTIVRNRGILPIISLIMALTVGISAITSVVGTTV